MTMPKKGTRKLEVAGKTYHWRLGGMEPWIGRWGPGKHAPRTMRLIVQAEDGTLVNAGLVSMRWDDDAYFLNDEYYLANHKASVTPGDVVQFIQTCEERKLFAKQRERHGIGRTHWTVGDYRVVAL